MNTPIGFGHASEPEGTPLHYTACGLGDVYLLSGYEIEDTPHGRTLSIRHLDELHRTIGLFIARHKKVMNGRDLRFLRKQMDLTQSELGAQIGLSSQQIARGEKGESEISGPTDRLVRALYLQFVTGELDLRKLVTRLDKSDASETGRTVFESTRRGWKIAA